MKGIAILTLLLMTIGCSISTPIGPIVVTTATFERAKALAERGDTKAQLALAKMYREGDGVAQNDVEASRWELSAARGGNAIGQYMIYMSYSSGRGVPKDDNQAMFWLEKSAEQGFAVAQNEFASQLYSGELVERDLRRAFTFFQEAIEGSGELKQANGLDARDALTESLDVALDDLQDLADSDDAEALTLLGDFYYLGSLLEQSYETAAQMYERAAVLDDASAQRSLALMYLTGEGVSQSYPEAVMWMRRAADQGYAPAQYALGWMYENGRGLDQSDSDAIKWYRKSAEQGYEQARRNLEELETQIWQAENGYNQYGCPIVPGNDYPSVELLVQLIAANSQDRGLSVMEFWGQCHACYMGLAEQANDRGIFNMAAQQAWRNSPMPVACDTFRDYYLANPNEWWR